MKDRREKPPYSGTMAMSVVVVVAVWMGVGVIVISANIPGIVYLSNR